MPQHTIVRVAIYRIYIRAGWVRANCCFMAAILTPQRSRAKFSADIMGERLTPIGQKIRKINKDSPIRCM